MNTDIIQSRRSTRSTRLYPDLNLNAPDRTRSPERTGEADTSFGSPNKSDTFSDNEMEENQHRRRSVDLSERFCEEKVIRASPVPAAFRHKTPAPTQMPQSKRNHYRIYAVVILAVVVFAFMNKKSPAESAITNKKIDCSQFLELTEKFPNQDQKLFKSLKSGIEGMFNGIPPEPSVFSLFSTDEDLINKMMDEVIRVTKQCINQSQDPISLSKDQLSDQLVRDYKDELEKVGIMIINNVDQASPSSVPSLHSFCDTYNPLVSKSIIFLTIKVPGAPQGKPVEYITDFLNDRWSDLKDNVRGPLIARMIDQTFFLKP